MSSQVKITNHPGNEPPQGRTTKEIIPIQELEAIEQSERIFKIIEFEMLKEVKEEIQRRKQEQDIMGKRIDEFRKEQIEILHMKSRLSIGTIKKNSVN